MSARRGDHAKDRSASATGAAAPDTGKSGMSVPTSTKTIVVSLIIILLLLVKDTGKAAPPPATKKECPTMGQLRTVALSGPQSKNIFIDSFDAITQADRSAATGQSGATVWMTGLSGSGKSTIGKELEKKVVLEDGKHMYRLDGDNLRFGLSKDLKLTAEDRNEAVRRAYEVSLLMAEAGVLSLVSLISPYQKDREAARELHKQRRIPFIEVFVEVDVSDAKERDPKGLYALHSKGKITGMTGIDAPYQPPVNPEIVLATGTCCGKEAAAAMLNSCKVEAKVENVKFQDHCPPVLKDCIDACVDQLHDRLVALGALTPGKKHLGSPPDAISGQSPPRSSAAFEQGPAPVTGHADGYPPNTTPPSLVEENESYWVSDEVTKLQPVQLQDVDVQWVQVIGEGWAAPLKGPMRESALVQALHFESLLVDPSGEHGGNSLYGPGPQATDFGDSERALNMAKHGSRVSMPIPITIAVNSQYKKLIQRACAKAAEAGQRCQVVLVSPAGEPVAVLDDPEVYVFRKEEMIARSWGAWDLYHPYVKDNIVDMPDYLLGGEFHKVRRIRYRDGLDEFRLTPQELVRTFQEKKADGVFAFQTRNPTHAGHAHLMKDGRQQLLAKGFQNPVLWLSPLGGWTKSDDVPLDVRVKQHKAVLDEKMLDPAWTVLSIWPSPMVYSGPTEVQWHAKSRRVVGADYFVVGRDPAGLTYSDQYARAHNQSKGDDVYDADHGRYVLQVSPGVGSLGLLASGAVHYDKRDGNMKPKPKGMTKDEFNANFLKISGSKMREMGKKMVDVCESLEAIPANWAENPACVPPNFMVPTGWHIMRNYYLNKDDPVVKANAVLQSKQAPLAARNVDLKNITKVGLVGNHFAAYFHDDGGKIISPWHDIPLKQGSVYNMVVEFAKGTNAKMEVQKELEFNPIKQDTKKGLARYYTYGMAFFNNGMFPQTWEDSAVKDEANNFGDNDPLDVMEIGSAPLPMGSVVPVKILGSLGLVDGGETDHKIIAISVNDPDADQINSIQDVAAVKGKAFVERIVDWLRRYKTTDKSDPDKAALNTFLREAEFFSAAEATSIIEHTSRLYQNLIDGKAEKTDATANFWLPRRPAA
ncbi:ATP sulfurylase 1 [Diplonema papillatum]|nr:ATP sulfurylase 1 [Diplonema papillatum]|eukprot:gene6216-9520_t